MLGSVLILCPEHESRDKIVASVRKCGLDPLLSSGYQEARDLLEHHDLAAVFCSDALEGVDYPEIIEAAKPVPVIILSRFAEWPLPGCLVGWSFRLHPLSDGPSRSGTDPVVGGSRASTAL